MNRPRISVVMPVYNGSAWVESAVRSIQDQTFGDWELVALDDGSADASAEILAHCARGDTRIRVFANGRNRGLAAAMNRLCSEAKGEYVAIQEQDDVSLPGRLAFELAVFEQHPEVGLVSGIAEWTGDGGEVIGCFPGLLERGGQYPQNRRDLVRFLYSSGFKVANACCMFRRSLIEAVPPFDESARSSIDWQFFGHAAHRTLFYGLNRPLVRVRRGRSHTSLTRNKALVFREARRCIDLLYWTYRDDPDSPIDRRLRLAALATELHTEGRYYGGFRGIALLTHALLCQPSDRAIRTSLFELFASGSRLLLSPSALFRRLAPARPQH